MNGVILYADDDVFTSNSRESDLYNSLLHEKKYPVLAVDSLDLFEETITSISSYKALIIDWEFKRQGIENGLQIDYEDPSSFLLDNNIYSLIYVYSRENIEGKEEARKLKEKYGDKLFFKIKDNDRPIEKEKYDILNDIKNFEERNQKLKVPYEWSKAINKSVQQIFYELEIADSNWVKKIHENTANDNIRSTLEVIDVFNNLLAESIIQNEKLIDSIQKSTQLTETIASNEKTIAKLYQRILYTKLLDSAPLMTGDIFILDQNEHAILITPECDIINREDRSLEFLVIEKKAFDEYLDKKQNGYKKENYTSERQKEKRFYQLLKLFNQSEMKFHFLPSFPFEENTISDTAVINFSSSLRTITKINFEKKRSKYKLNSPFVHQLRQRYLSYIGRVGVPSIPKSVREYNLK
jgi:hypothetical protein